MRGLLKISQKKVPKRAFRARLPQILAEQCFQNTIFHNPRPMRGAIPRVAFRHSFVQSTHRILRDGSSCKIKMCVSLQRRAIQNFQICVSLQRRAQKCMNPAHDVRGNPRHTKITILPQFQTSDQHEVTRRLRRPLQNLRFITVLEVR